MITISLGIAINSWLYNTTYALPLILPLQYCEALSVLGMCLRKIILLILKSMFRLRIEQTWKTISEYPFLVVLFQDITLSVEAGNPRLLSRRG